MSFWEDVGMYALWLLAAIVFAGVIAGLIFSAEARIALGFWFAVVGFGVVVRLVRGPS